MQTKVVSTAILADGARKARAPKEELDLTLSWINFGLGPMRDRRGAGCYRDVAVAARPAGGVRPLPPQKRAGASLRGRPRPVSEPLVQLGDELLRRLGNDRAGREDGGGAGRIERLEVLRRHDAADDDHDVVAGVALELRLELRHEGQVGGGERGDADDVDVVLDRLASGLGRGREERPDVDVEAEVRERRGDHLLAAVMAVLAHLGDEDARAPAVVLLEGLDEGAHPL